MAKTLTQDFPTSMTAVPGQQNETRFIPQPPPSAFKGRYRNRKDGFLYSHAQMDHPDGKTHKAMIPAQYKRDDNGAFAKDKDGNQILLHSGLFWEGTAEEFKAAFDRE